MTRRGLARVKTAATALVMTLSASMGARFVGKISTYSNRLHLRSLYFLFRQKPWYIFMGFSSGKNFLGRLKWYGKIMLFDSQKADFGLSVHVRGYRDDLAHPSARDVNGRGAQREVRFVPRLDA